MKSKIKNYWKIFLEYIEYNKKRIIIHIGFFTAIVAVLLLIDLLTKGLLFEWGDELEGKHQGTNEYSWKNAFFGIRSISNSGLTVFGGILPHGVIHFFNFIILFICIGFLIFIKSKSFITAIAFIFAGTLGNMIDRFAFQGHVRDIIFLPWADSGTFNFADVDALTGTIIALIALVVQIIKQYTTSKNKND